MFTSSRAVNTDGKDNKVLLFCVRLIQKCDDLDDLSGSGSRLVARVQYRERL